MIVLDYVLSDYNIRSGRPENGGEVPNSDRASPLGSQGGRGATLYQKNKSKEMHTRSKHEISIN